MVGNNNAFNSSGEDIHISACTYNSTEGDFLWEKPFDFFQIQVQVKRMILSKEMSTEIIPALEQVH